MLSLTETKLERFYSQKNPFLFQIVNKEECQQQEELKEAMAKLLQEINGSSKGITASYTVQGSDREYIETLQASLSSRIDLLTSTVEKLQANILSSGGRPVAIEEIGVVRDAKTENWLRNIEDQKHVLQNLLVLTETTSREVKNLPSRLDIEVMSNNTQDTLQEMKEKFIAISDRGVDKVTMKIEEGLTTSNDNHKDVMKIIEDMQGNSETLYDDMTKSYDQLLGEVKGLSKVEEVMVQTADNVLDTKRRIEYGVHQILLEVGDLIKLQGKNLNGTVNQRFDDIESTILDNQTGALTNLSSKIETEISQVWRQIGIMYQQLTASASALDRLQEQTDAYVNGSVRTMDSMEGKVGMITSRMSEVDDNLNYLLGKLSLVTSEFNQIKSGLASALDNIRNSFLEVQNEIKDVGPGPRPIKTENQVLP